MAQLREIDWPLLQRRDFKRDADDPRKMERYQAEALLYRHLPIQGVLGTFAILKR
ncbi:DarT ssDNA thymidine ADP-ribosyltransferase family protein [Collimonas sp. OK607]|uniref:DarT ssDNA thymidine ADP-ribosyltransferase family protein n=1 Tax=Collimonas sp. OK607 TaxID=1798194 RepID=UPI00352B4461